ncbi:putative tetratricopeptide-like helical domain superfamily [Plasmopara halstedii]
MSSEAYTVSKMLSNINEIMAPVATDACGSVTLQRKTKNGIMLNTTKKEVAYLDMKAKIKHSAQHVAQLGKMAKAQWIATQRQAGKDAFNKGDYKLAAEAYIKALTALDFGSTTAEKVACQQDLQIPLTCNLAACMLMTEQWDKARLMCDQALAIDPNCVKALQQRAKSKAKVADFHDARADVLRAKQIIGGPSPLFNDASDQLKDRLQKELEGILRAERRHKLRLQHNKKFQRKMMQKAVGRLYTDKEEIQNADNISNALLSHHKSLLLPTRRVQICYSLDAGIEYLLAFFAMLITAISRLLVAKDGKATVA